MLHKKSFNYIRQDWDLESEKTLYIVFDFLSELVGNKNMLYKVFSEIPEEKFVVTLSQTTIKFIEILVPVLKRQLNIDQDVERIKIEDYIDREISGLWFLKIGSRKYYIQDRFFAGSKHLIKGESLKEAILLALDVYKK